MAKATTISLLQVFISLAAWAQHWKEVRFTPARIALSNSSASQRFVVSARDESGKWFDVTESCRITVSNPTVAIVDAAGGVVRGKAPGQTRLRIALGNIIDVAEVSVASQSARVDVRFSPDVISILTIKGCNSSGCHGSP